MIGRETDAATVMSSPALRRLVLTCAFALCAVLLAHGLILNNQATALLGGVLLAIAFVLVIVDASHVPNLQSEDPEFHWERD